MNYQINHNRLGISSLVLTIILLTTTSYAQETAKEKKPDKPVRSTFETTVLIDNQTIRNPGAKSLELLIHHRFGPIKNGLSDLYGIYAPSNIRLGVNYGVTKRISVGFGTEKNNKMQEFHWKYNILRQTRSGSVPVAIAYFGNCVIDGRDEANFGANYEFISRISYFNQLIIARRFNNRLSLQLAAGYTHFNAVGLNVIHDNLGLCFGGRFKVYNDNSIIFEYDHSFPIEGSNVYSDDSIEPKDNLAIGFEFGTSTHAFQIFLAYYDNIIAQKNYAYNQNDFTDGKLLLGFNITVRF